MKVRSKPAPRVRHEKVCEVCGAKFLTHRADTLFCSNGCKQRAYRQRKATA